MSLKCLGLENWIKLSWTCAISWPKLTYLYCSAVMCKGRFAQTHSMWSPACAPGKPQPLCWPVCQHPAVGTLHRAVQGVRGGSGSLPLLHLRLCAQCWLPNPLLSEGGCALGQISQGSTWDKLGMGTCASDLPHSCWLQSRTSPFLSPGFKLLGGFSAGEDTEFSLLKSFERAWPWYIHPAFRPHRLCCVWEVGYADCLPLRSSRQISPCNFCSVFFIVSVTFPQM